jgi:putative chitinase
MLTLEQFEKMIPTNKSAKEWYDIAEELFPKYDLTTANRIAGFMAQAGHESGDFKVLQENLNYSETALLKTFGRYFTKETAKQFARKPEMIANRVYDDANRTNKLGNTQPGDGWRFRGRGLIQLTGRWNYEKFGKSVDMTAEEAAAYMETKKGAMESALWFWRTNNLNRFADADDIRGMSRAVNGGDNGMNDRVSRYSRNKNAFVGLTSATPVNPQITDAVTTPAAAPQARSLQRGAKGDLVRRVQQSLRISVDGIYGVTTEAAVRSWQRANKYPITGKLDETQISQIVK